MPRINKNEVEEVEKSDVRKVQATPPWQLIAIGVLGTVMVLALCAVGMRLISGLNHSQKYEHPGWMQESDKRGGSRFERRGGFGGHMLADNAIVGVITAIDGDTLTVSGGGKQVKVKKADTTKIGGDKTDVAVNDSVIVVGDKDSDGNVTATRIIVRNEVGRSRMTPDA